MHGYIEEVVLAASIADDALHKARSAVKPV
jgi:hypothetical protein